MTPAIRTAWLRRVIDRAFPNPYPAGTLGDIIGRDMACSRIMEEASKRDPLIDPDVGDRIIVHPFDGRPMLTFHIVKTMRMRTRGTKRGGPLVDHVAVRIESRAGDKIETRGRNYTLAKLRELFAVGRVQVLECGR